MRLPSHTFPLMKVLIVGSGGREHALAWKVAQSTSVDIVYVAPGNAGTAMEDKVRNVTVGADDIDALVKFARENMIDMTIIGPEGPLVNGVVDTFSDAGLACFGPSRLAAALEGSKSFTKDFLRRHNIPTADYQVFTDHDAARDYIRQKGAPIVVKADGLAAGKGVIVAGTVDEAYRAVNDMLVAGKYGDAGYRVVIEEYLQGEEASFIIMCDGIHILPLASSQDHKARDRGDSGPNTGGMGAYSPALVVTAAVHDRIMREVIEPAVSGMDADGRSYVGFLYAGLMIASDGSVRVLEFNCRFGDPEAQPIMMRLKSDLVELCSIAMLGGLDNISIKWDDRAAVGIVLAAGGYPGSSKRGDIIHGLKDNFHADVKIFHAGTALQDHETVTSGGRVLCVTSLGDNVTLAQALALQSIQKIHWEGMFFRDDIGYWAIAREQQ